MISNMKKYKLPNTDGNCQSGSVIQGKNFRFTIFTSQLIRMEYSQQGIFEDRPTQVVINRNFNVPKFEVFESKDRLEIDTEWLSISYDKKEFSIGGLSVKVRSECRGIYSTWRFSEPVNEGLWGTARTLDQADGAIELEEGLLSRLGGFGVIDDSKSLVLLENGWVEPREEDIEDIYFFGYGYEYKQCLRDYFHLCGKTPLLPRFALGNWWSRYYPYSHSEYKDLMDRFAGEEVPLSVAVIDMDWHIVDVNPKHGKGWTGYTWNNELFPDPKVFLTELHNRDLKVTLNLHPAEGVQPHEEMYEEMSRSLGRNPKLKQPIHFDFSDPDFIEAYFTYLHHPQEENGVDFWWIDWQQGNVSKLKDADPLWMLNHFHFLDSYKKQQRPMIFSRYAGCGSHRYPIGFSGDSIISWKSLQFQPYFTANASNIGYGWWSHDIGGHASGSKDSELMVRWVQFGVFSPIMRLHSTSNIFNGKEPWKYGKQACSIMTEFLQLRHKLIPYIYTMNWDCHKEGNLLVQPMYYNYPRDDEAYEVRNQYEFGSEIMVCPITSAMDSSMQLGFVKAWLPKGIWFDFFTGTCYTGNRLINMYRPIDTIPVLAKAGAIIPMTGEAESKRNGVDLPVEMQIKVFGGASGSFAMYEDDGESLEYINDECAITNFELVWNSEGTSNFIISPVSKKIDVVPIKRQYKIDFYGIADTDNIAVMADESPVRYSKEYNKELKIVSIMLPLCDVDSSIKILFNNNLSVVNNDVKSKIFKLLDRTQVEYELKENIYNIICSAENNGIAICELQVLNLQKNLLGAISEILFAQ